MVYDLETFAVLHRLTPEGEKRYRQFLEDKGTEIIFRSEHPVRYWFGRIIGFFADFAH